MELSNIQKMIGWLEIEKSKAEVMKIYNLKTNPNEWRAEFYSGRKTAFDDAIDAARLLLNEGSENVGKSLQDE